MYEGEPAPIELRKCRIFTSFNLGNATDYAIATILSNQLP